jgi:hypothetical protein
VIISLYIFVVVENIKESVLGEIDLKGKRKQSNLVQPGSKHVWCNQETKQTSKRNGHVRVMWENVRRLKGRKKASLAYYEVILAGLRKCQNLRNRCHEHWTCANGARLDIDHGVTNPSRLIFCSFSKAINTHQFFLHSDMRHTSGRDRNGTRSTSRGTVVHEVFEKYLRQQM